MTPPLPPDAPEVSVLVPSYQHASFLEECLRSVLVEREVPLELVVVDDGSTDGSPEILARLAAEDPRVHWERQENRGAHEAFRRCLELARGELLFLLNSDDAYHPERVRTLVDVLARHPESAAAASWLEVVDASGALLGTKEAWRTLPPWPRPGTPGLVELGDPDLALLETNWIATTSNLAVRRSAIEDHGLDFLSLRYTHDWDFFLRAALAGGIRLVERPLCRYRVHASNTIKEGEATGAGPMRFEILWTVARHADRLLAAKGRANGVLDEAAPALDDLTARFLRAAPRFGRPDVLSVLLLLRGDAAEPSPAFDALLDPAHPLRRRAEELLGAEA